MRQILIMTALSVFALSAVAQDKNPFIPEIHGTVRAKYEYEPQIDKGRFEITVTNITYRISLMQSNCIYISPLYRKYYINIKFIRLLQYKNRWENNSPHLTHIKTIFFTLDFML